LLRTLPDAVVTRWRRRQFKGAKMGDPTATGVIEARSLLREALSLMESHSYKVICSSLSG